MNISIIGTGYVGLVTAVCFANAGHNVMCLDIDKTKIKKLKKGISPIYEPDLEELLIRSLKKGHIDFTSDKEKSVSHGYFQFICVGTPQFSNGSPNLEFFKQAVRDVSSLMKSEKIIINKSTIPVGMSKTVKSIISSALKKRKVNLDFDVVSNPEFLREGSAVKDFLHPDRVIIGTKSPKSRKELNSLYTSVGIKKDKIVLMSEESAELTKYAANAFLATKISFINEIANFSEKVGADIKEIQNGIGLDKRIGSEFLNAGCGYGGSCFPKDVDALILMTKKNKGKESSLLREVKHTNNRQKLILIDKLKKALGNKITNKRIAVWGLSFKPNTDDVRESPSISVIKKLLDLGAKVYAHDPIAINSFKAILEDKNLFFCKNIKDTYKGSDAILLVTNWDQYINYDFEEISKKMRNRIILDGRNSLKKADLENMGFKYEGIGV